MKGYLIELLSITAVLLVLAFVLKLTGMAFFQPVPLWMLPVAVLYFALVYGFQYWTTVTSIHKRPKAFVQFFLSTTVGVLFLHIIVLIGGMLINPMGGKRFAVAFLVLYIVYLIHITVSLVRFMRSVGKQ